MLPETKKIFDCVKSYLQEPAQDALSDFYIYEKHFVKLTEQKMGRI